MSTPPKLSICISTFNRAAFIGETLESIVSQATENCEIVVSDNASPDNTENVVGQYERRCSCLRYIKHDTDLGMDRNYDRALELARGEYCWLLSDDDPLKPGAVASVLKALANDFSLVLVNSEARDASLSTIIQGRIHDIRADQVYEPTEMDRLFSDLKEYVQYLSAYVIKRDIWRERERERYYGSLYLFVGIVFQKCLPGKALVMAEPLMYSRFGNFSTFSPNAFEVFTINWSSVVWSLGISDVTKRKCVPKEPWRSPSLLLIWRAISGYSISEYRRCVRPRLRTAWERLIPLLIAVVPIALANASCTMYFCGPRQRIMQWVLRESRFHMRNSRRPPAFGGGSI